MEYRFIESIKIERGAVYNQDLHQQRMSETASKFGFAPPMIPDLIGLLPEMLISKKVKCRIVYSSVIEHIEFCEYVMRPISSLKIVECDNIEYSHKYLDRSAIDELLLQKGESDDVLIVKRALITDTSFSNVLFVKDGQYFTPDSYLLNGVKRQQLLSQQRIIATKIGVEDVARYDYILLINSMIDIEDGAPIFLAL